MLILAGDVGGTSTRLTFFEADAPGLQLWPTCITRAGSMTEIVMLFMKEQRLTP